jgi:hypothetical protein
MKGQFSTWVRWNDRNALTVQILQYPGIYAIARTEENIAGLPFDWREDIVYFGMSNAKGGLKSRLQQFENTIKGKTGHGGAQRVIFHHRDYNELVRNLFVAVSHTECKVTSNLPDDLRLMGEVARQEYWCLAEYAERFGRLPQFNDKKLSPKK